MKAPEVRCVVNRATADLLTVEYGWLLDRCLGFGLAESVGLALPVIHQEALAQKLDLVVCEVLLTQVRALLQNNDTEARGGEFLGDHAARRTGSDHDKVDCVRGAKPRHPTP